MRGNLKGLGIGAAGGLIASGSLLAIYFVASARAEGADGGDWLQFASVFFGVTATIAGTLAIERIKRGRAHSNAVKNLLGALDIWCATLDTLPADLNNARIADLRQQHAYISFVSGDISRDQGRASMATHLFCFHVPKMIDALAKSLDVGGEQEVLVVTYAINEMRSYANTVPVR